MSSRIPTVATCSIDAFARRGGWDTRNIDGWGVAFYNDRDVRIYREPEPAGDSPWLSFIKRRRLPGRLMLSHVRHATQGVVSLVNTQPFARELGGHMHVFAHNGRLDGIEARFAGEWRRFQPIGTTDSEVAFCILLERLSVLWRGSETPPLVQRLAVVARFAAQMRELGPANFLYADGDVLFAHGDRRLQADGEIAPPGLWRLRRECTTDPDASPRASVVTGAGALHQEITLIASVPLNAERWMPLAEGEVIVVKDGAACLPPRADGREVAARDSARRQYRTKESRGEVPPYHARRDGAAKQRQSRENRTPETRP